MNRTPVNYKNIAKALEFYENLGYQYVEVPWLVDPPAYEITSPTDCRAGVLWDRRIVASAEQSFLQMMVDRTLPKADLLMAASPCFRGEPEDEFHKEYFFKVELFSTQNVVQNTEEHINHAARFFAERIGIPVKRVRMTDTSWDLVDTSYGIELGSYGYREHELVGAWSYGTGCAEPRTSQVKKWL